MKILYVNQIVKILGELYNQPMKGMNALKILDVLEEIQPEVDKVAKISKKILDKYTEKDIDGNPTANGVLEENIVLANDEYIETMLSKDDVELKNHIEMSVIESLEIKGTELSLLIQEKIVTRKEEENK